MIESIYIYSLNGNNIEDKLLNKIFNSKLYDENYNNIALVIVNKSDNYTILIDLY